MNKDDVIRRKYEEFVAIGMRPYGDSLSKQAFKKQSKPTAVSKVAKVFNCDEAVIRKALRRTGLQSTVSDVGGRSADVASNPSATTSQASLTSASSEGESAPHSPDLQDFIANIASPPSREAISIQKYKSCDKEIVPVFLFSDWHIGETIDPNQVFNYNEFNEQIADARVNLLISKGIGLAQTYTKADTAFIWLGGDFVSGWLHEETKATDYCTPLQAIHWCCKKLYSTIKHFASTYKKVSIACSPGNHGRLTERPFSKQSTSTAFDWLIYAQLKSWLESETNIDFNIPLEGDCWIEIFNHKFLFTHGHQLGVRGGGDGEIGILGPMLRGAKRTARSLTALGRPFETMVIGHFHQSVWHPAQGLIANGAFCGFNEYARTRRFRAERPSQLLFFVHPDYGAILPMDIFLTD